VVGNLRLDQAWGGAQVMGALHEVNAVGYSAVNTAGTAPAVPTGGHPADQWGWAAGFGLKLNLPSISQGDWFQAQFNATNGALRYLFNTPNSNWGMVNGAQEAYGVLSDCVYGGTTAVGNNTSCHLTTAYGFNAGFEHFWVPNFHTSLYGAYYAVKYDTTANAMLCEIAGFGNGLGGAAAVGTPGCNNNWSMWGIGSRTQWDVTKTFYLGVEVLYEDLHSASTGTGLLTPVVAGGDSYAFGGASQTEADAHSWMVSVRAHRDFLP
jgi:porin-like protein